MKHFLRSLGFAVAGIRAAWSGQRHLRFHFGATLLVVALGIYLEVSTTDWCLLALAIGMVLSAELMNSAIESVVNLVQPATHPLAGMAKDIAAGAVLVAAIASLVIGLLVFIKYVPA